MTEASGWDIHASQSQAERRRWQDLAVHLGRELSATPSHLSRALYVSRHDSTSSDLALYDISTRYSEAVGETPVGTSKYVVELGMMKRPGEGDDGDIVYRVGFDKLDFVLRKVRYPGTGVEDDEVQLQAYVCISLLTRNEVDGLNRSISSSDEEACSFILIDALPSSLSISMGISYPIAPSKTKAGTFKHPYFTFHVPLSEESGLETFQWQIYPVEHGPLRYTFVRIPPATQGGTGLTSSDGGRAEILAIYHHIGLGASLSQEYSEGVLLLPDSTRPVPETLVVGSLLGMLWRLRELGSEKGKEKKYSFGSVKNMLKGKR